MAAITVSRRTSGACRGNIGSTGCGAIGSAIRWPISRGPRHVAAASDQAPGRGGAGAGQADAAVTPRYLLPLAGGVSMFETLQILRPFEDVLIDVAQDTAEINRLADMLMDYNAVVVENALAVGADAISVGDDYGTQQAMMMSPKVWRRFFKPRYRELFAPMLAAGKARLLPLVRPRRADPRRPGRGRRERHLAATAAVRPSRAGAALPGAAAWRCRCTPTAVSCCNAARRNRCAIICCGWWMSSIRSAGGSWLYLEVDPGFPWANVEAMYETAIALRLPQARESMLS